MVLLVLAEILGTPVRAVVNVQRTDRLEPPRPGCEGREQAGGDQVPSDTTNLFGATWRDNAPTLMAPLLGWRRGDPRSPTSVTGKSPLLVLKFGLKVERKLPGFVQALG